MFQTNPECRKKQNIFLWYLLHKKNWNQRVLMLIISPFILDDHFLQGIIKNLSWRCKQVSEMQNEDALLSCTTLQYTRLKGVSLKARFMLINLASAFSLSAERFHVWDFGREKKTKALNMVYFYWWHRWDLFHFLLDSQLLGIFNGFFFKFKRFHFI